MRNTIDVNGKKPTLADVRGQQYFDLSVLAEKAGVSLEIIERILNGQPVKRYLAELVLVALSDELGEEITLETVEILLVPEHVDQQEEKGEGIEHIDLEN